MINDYPFIIKSKKLHVIPAPDRQTFTNIFCLEIVEMHACVLEETTGLPNYIQHSTIFKLLILLYVLPVNIELSFVEITFV